MADPSNQTSAYITTTRTWITTENNTSESMCRIYQPHVITACLIFLVVLLEICFVVYGIYYLVKIDQSASAFVINLFISDLVQTSSKLTEISTQFVFLIRDFESLDTLIMLFLVFYSFGVIANICFMVCVSAERYVMIAHPVWYRNKHTTRKSVCVSITVWITSPILLFIGFYMSRKSSIGLMALGLLPYPLMIFFLVGTWRALSKTTVAPNDQRRIMGTLALILCIHTILILPSIAIIMSIDLSSELDCSCFYKYQLYSYISNILIALNPLFDFPLYLLMRRDAKHILGALCSCCRKSHGEDRVTDTQKRAQV